MTNPWGLSPREAEVCEALTEGHVGEKMLSRYLGTSTYTVRAQLASSFRKMGVTNMTMAALAYDRWKRQ